MDQILDADPDSRRRRWPRSTILAVRTDAVARSAASVSALMPFFDLRCALQSPAVRTGWSMRRSPSVRTLRSSTTISAEPTKRSIVEDRPKSRRKSTASSLWRSSTDLARWRLEILSQCNTIFAMRMTNQVDQRVAEHHLGFVQDLGLVESRAPTAMRRRWPSRLLKRASRAELREVPARLPKIGARAAETADRRPPRQKNCDTTPIGQIVRRCPLASPADRGSNAYISRAICGEGESRPGHLVRHRAWRRPNQSPYTCRRRSQAPVRCIYMNN